VSTFLRRQIPDNVLKFFNGPLLSIFVKC